MILMMPASYSLLNIGYNHFVGYDTESGNDLDDASYSLLTVRSTHISIRHHPKPGNNLNNASHSVLIVGSYDFSTGHFSESGSDQ